MPAMPAGSASWTDADDTSADKRELSSLKRGLRVLRALNTNGSVSAAAMAIELNVPRTTARRILDTLVSEGVAQKIPNDSLYCLAPQAAQLSNGVGDSTVISYVAAPILYAVTQQIGWALSIVTIDETDVVVQAASHSQSRYALTSLRVGDRTPIAKSQAGQTLLAFLPDHEREALLERIRREDPQSAAPEGVSEPLSVIRAQGFSNFGTRHERQSLLCLPMFGAGRVRGCLVMQYMGSAITPAAIQTDYAPRLQAIAADISDQGQKVFDDFQIALIHRYARSGRKLL